MSNTPLIAFDFDGVLVDSINEVLLCAHYAAGFGLEPSGKYTQNFLNYRYQIQQAGDFIPFAKWCWNPNGEPMDQVNAEKVPLKERTKLFFQTRNKLIEKLGDKWLSLHRMFPKACEILNSLPKEDFVVVTHKNKTSVLKLSKHLGIDVNEEQLYTGDSGAQKSEHLRRAWEQHAKRETIFVDDSIKNLIEVKNNFSQAKLFLATWGYVGPKDADEALEQGIEFGKENKFLEFLPNVL